MATADGNESVKRKKNYTQTHTPHKTNKQKDQRKKHTHTHNKTIGLNNVQLYMCRTLFFWSITLQFAVTARQVDDGKIPIFDG